MKSRFYSILLVAALQIASAVAQSSDTSSALSELRDRYDRDIQRTFLPLTEKYIDALKLLLKKQMVAGDLSEAKATEAEIVKVTLQKSLAGKWKESRGATISISPFGHVSDTKVANNVGVWIAKGDGVQIVWANGYIDYVSLSKNGALLEGKNNQGAHLAYRKKP